MAGLSLDTSRQFQKGNLNYHMTCSKILDLRIDLTEMIEYANNLDPLHLSLRR